MDIVNISKEERVLFQKAKILILENSDSAKVSNRQVAKKALEFFNQNFKRV